MNEMILTHQETHFSSTDLIKDIVIGMSDGLTVPFALAAGLSGALAAKHIIITAGLSEIIAGSIAMGLGGYLAGQTETDHYKSEMAKEYDEVNTIPDKEKEEIKELFAAYGFSASSQILLADELSKDKDKWVKFMMKYELGLEEPDARRATKSALNIGLSYIVGGLIPLLPYFFTSNPLYGLKLSAGITLFCLFIFGSFKSKFTGQPIIKSALKVTLIGAVAAFAAFWVAKFFGA